MEQFSYESTEPMAVRKIRTDVNPTANTVSAFLKTAGQAAPSTGDPGWIPGTWQTTEQQADGLWKTDAWFTLTAHNYPRGYYDVHVWIDGSTYDPVILADRIVIY